MQISTERFTETLERHARKYCEAGSEEEKKNIDVAIREVIHGQYGDENLRSTHKILYEEYKQNYLTTMR